MNHEKIIYQLREMRISVTKAIEAVQSNNTLEVIHQMMEVSLDCDLVLRWVKNETKGE